MAESKEDLDQRAYEVLEREFQEVRAAGSVRCRRPPGGSRGRCGKRFGTRRAGARGMRGVEEGGDMMCSRAGQGYKHRRNHSQVLQELVGDRSLERFRIEYEKLYRALKKSHGARAGQEPA